jgi:hypothetical protein
LILSWFLVESIEVDSDVKSVLSVSTNILDFNFNLVVHLEAVTTDSVLDPNFVLAILEFLGV